MRRLLVWTCVFVLPCACWAQNGNSSTSWKNLDSLHAGERIRVADTSYKKHSGAFVSFSDQAITIEEKHGAETIQRGEVSGVSLAGRHRLRNALVGGAIGAGAGAGIGAAAGSSNKIGGRGAMAALFAAVGFVGGAVVGAILPGHKTIYRASPQR